MDEPLYFYVGGDIISCGDVHVPSTAACTAIVSLTASYYDTSETIISNGSTYQGGPNEGVRYYDYDTIVKITVKKPSQAAKLGLGLTKVDGLASCTSVQVNNISESSPFHATSLCSGITIFVGQWNNIHKI